MDQIQSVLPIFEWNPMDVSFSSSQTKDIENKAYKSSVVTWEYILTFFFFLIEQVVGGNKLFMFSWTHYLRKVSVVAQTNKLFMGRWMVLSTGTKTTGGHRKTWNGVKSPSSRQATQMSELQGNGSEHESRLKSNWESVHNHILW